MSRLTVAAAVLALAGSFAGGEARAQYAIPGTYGPPAAAYSLAPAGAVAGTTATAPQAIHRYPYSYYVAYPHAARGYVGYGDQDSFAYHGRPYGHPYDPWTWPYMTGSYHGSLARYYDPPVK